MTASLVGPGGRIDVSDRAERLLGKVTLDSGGPTGGATETTLAAVLLELGQKLEAGQSIALDGPTLTALEEIETRSPLKAMALDYAARTDAQPVYLGSAAPASVESAAVWTVTRFTYESASNDARIIRSDVRSPIRWTNRTDPTQDGQPAW